MQWWVVIPAVLAAALAGYMLNVLIVALYSRIQIKEPIAAIIRQMHVGIFGEFVLSYMGLALFSVLVAISTETTGLWAFVVFIAPLAFARQMFTRTHSLQEATNELAMKQAENEYPGAARRADRAAEPGSLPAAIGCLRSRTRRTTAAASR